MAAVKSNITIEMENRSKSIDLPMRIIPKLIISKLEY
jgi:hypothetical protein